MVLQNMMTKNHIAEVLFLPVHSEINNCCFPVKPPCDSFWARAAQPGSAFRREPQMLSLLAQPPGTNKQTHENQNQQMKP